MLRDFGFVTVVDLARRPARRDGRPAGGARCWHGASDEGPLLDRRRAALPGGHRRSPRSTRSSGGGGGTLGLDKLPRALAAAGVRRARPPPGQLEGDANVAQDDCETSQLPCPADARRTPACRIGTAGAIRVCDLFDRPLVISFWFTKGGELRRPAGRGRARLPALPWAGELPLAGHPRRSRHGSRTDPPARLDDAGRLRPRRRRRQPLPGRRLPDLRLRLPRRDAAERQHRRPHRRRSSSDRVDAPAARDRARRRRG